MERKREMGGRKMGKKGVIAILGVLLWCGGLVLADYVDIYEDTVINNNLDADSFVNVHDSAQVTVLDTGYVSFTLLDTSTVKVYGGNASYEAQASSVLELYSGDFTTRSPSVRYEGSLAKIYIHGQNFNYQRFGGEAESGMLSGNWLDDSTFDIYLRNLPQSFEDSLGINIFLVPEPGTIGLFGLGCLVLRKRAKILHR